MSLLEATQADGAEDQEWTDAKMLCEEIMKVLKHAEKSMQDDDEAVRSIRKLLFDDFYREVTRARIGKLFLIMRI